MNRLLDEKFNEIIEVAKRKVTAKDKMWCIYDLFREVRNCTKPLTIANDIATKIIELFKIANSQNKETDWSEILDSFYSLYYSSIYKAITREQNEIEIYIIDSKEDVWKTKRVDSKLEDLRNIAGKALGKI